MGLLRGSSEDMPSLGPQRAFTATQRSSRLGIGLVLLGASACHDDECHTLGASWCRGDEIVTCAKDQGDTMTPLGGGADKVVEPVQNCAEGGQQCLEQAGEPACGFADRTCDRGLPVCVGNVVATCADARVHPEAVEECQDELPICVVGLLAAHCSAVSETCDPATAAQRCVEPWVYECRDGVWQRLLSAPDGRLTPCD